MKIVMSRVCGGDVLDLTVVIYEKRVFTGHAGWVLLAVQANRTGIVIGRLTRVL